MSRETIIKTVKIDRKKRTVTEDRTRQGELTPAPCCPVNWRREPPDRAGWWWEWYEGKAKCIDMRGPRLAAWKIYGIMHGVWWAGPLEPPPPPVSQGNEPTLPAPPQSQ